MPPIIIAVIAAVAAYGGAYAAAVGFGIAITSLGAIAAGALVGSIVAMGAGMAFQALAGKQKSPSVESTAADQKQLVRSSVAARRVIYGRAKVSGPIVYATSTGPDLQNMHLVVPLAGHQIEAVETLWIEDTPIQVSDLVDGQVVTGKYANLAAFGIHLGNQLEADASLVAETADGWDGDHRLLGIAYLHVRLVYNREAYTGIPNIAATVLGRNQIYDPRSGTYGYTTNWALCCLDYLLAEFGLACSAADEIDMASVIAAANLSDEAVPLNADASITQTRYTANGTFTLDEAPIAVMEKLLASGAGALVYVAGQYRLHGGAYITPSGSLGPSDFAGSVELQTMPPRAELFNGVRGTFIDPGRYFQASEYPLVQDYAALTADGEEVWREVDFAFVDDATRAQRLARQTLYRMRSPLTLRAPVRYASIQFAIWQTITVTLPDFGWVDKPFRIASFTFNPSDATCNLTLIEEQVSAYAWLYDAALSVPDNPNTTLVSPFDVAPPAGLYTEEAIYVTRDGTSARTKLAVSWLPAANPFVRDYEIQYSTTAGATWLATTPTSLLTAEILDLPAGTYYVRVRARTQSAVSDWIVTYRSVGGLLASPPADITNLAIQSIGGMAWLRWDRVPDLDVRAGGRIEIRHTADASGGTWIGATSIGDAVSGDATFAALPLKPGTYLAKAVDAGGRYSPGAASVLSEQATALAFSTQATLTEHPTFSGVKSATLLSGGTLRLDSSGLLDASADFDAIADVDLLGGIAGAGSYAFSGGIDLGAVMGIRMTTNLSAIVVNSNDTLDSRPALVDDWLGFDGAVGGEADAWVECRYTPDDPAGSPTWSTWRRVDASEFSGRGFQFRAQLESSDPAFNIHVSALSVTAAKVV